MTKKWLLLWVVASVACSSSTNNYSSAKDAGADGAGGASGASGAGGAVGGTSSGGSGAKDAGTDAPVACTTTTVQASLLADAAIIPELGSAGPNCDATITLGTNPLMSVGGVVPQDPSRTLLRFKLGDEIVKAIGAAKVKSAKLTVFRAMTGCPNECPAKAGLIRVLPLTSQWAEGTQNGEGAQWCFGERADKSLPWGEPGAKKAGDDHGDPCGQLDFNGTDQTVSFELDPKPLMPWADPNDTLSIMLVSGGGTLFMYARENSAKQPPQLSFELCQ